MIPSNSTADSCRKCRHWRMDAPVPNIADYLFSGYGFCHRFIQGVGSYTADNVSKAIDDIGNKNKRVMPIYYNFTNRLLFITPKDHCCKYYE